MRVDTLSSPSRKVRIAAVGFVAILLVVAAMTWPPYALPSSYHAFADQRAILGIANFWNTVTNLPVLVVGALGLWHLRARASRPIMFESSGERRAYVTFFVGVVLASLGSAYYHLAPTDARLVWDRLPITIALTSLVSAQISERIDARVGGLLLFPLVGIGLASVLYWRWSAIAAIENLIPYGAVQFGSLALLLLISALFPSRYDRPNDIYWVLGLYALAKVAENADVSFFEWSGRWFSGHSLKHLLAAAAAYWILLGLSLRRLSAPVGTTPVASNV